MQWKNHKHRHHGRHNNHHHPQPPSNHHRRCLGRDLSRRESDESFEGKHVVIVMDAMKVFTVNTLEWVIKNIVLDSSCTITLLGVKPWLNFVRKYIVYPNIIN